MGVGSLSREGNFCMIWKDNVSHNVLELVGLDISPLSGSFSMWNTVQLFENGTIMPVSSLFFWYMAKAHLVASKQWEIVW